MSKTLRKALTPTCTFELQVDDPGYSDTEALKTVQKEKQAYHTNFSETHSLAALTIYQFHY